MRRERTSSSLGAPRGRWVRSLLAAGVATALGGCSALDILSSASSNALAAARDVQFSSTTDLELDMYVPDDARAFAPPYPVIVFLHGGGWRNGNRQEYEFVASGLTRQGYMVVIPDMRKYPDVRFPEFVYDAADAVKWSFANVERWGGDPSSLFLMGHSSGAHIAALLHFDPRYLNNAGEPSTRPCGFIGLSGPYDFLPLVSPALKGIFPESLRDDSQPTNFVTGNETPTLLLHGLQDQTVKPRNSASLEERIREAGGSAQLTIYEKRKHAALVLALSPTLKFLAPVLDDVNAFIAGRNCPKSIGN